MKQKRFVKFQFSEKFWYSKMAQKGRIAGLLACRYRHVSVPLPYRSRFRYRSPHRKPYKAPVMKRAVS